MPHHTARHHAPRATRHTPRHATHHIPHTPHHQEAGKAYISVGGIRREKGEFSACHACSAVARIGMAETTTNSFVEGGKDIVDTCT